MTFLKGTFERKNLRIIKWVLFTLFFCLNLIQINSHFKGKYENLIASDARGYFEYLPYVFVFHNVENMYFSYKLENGKRFDKYPCGVAMLEAPFHLASLFVYNPPVDKTASYGQSYALSVAIASSFYLAISLVLLFSLYRKIFDIKTALINIGILYFGTNLFYYSVFEPGMSHVYSFFCFSAFLFFLDRLFGNASFVHIFSAAFFLSLAIAVRPTNAIMAVMYPLYNVYNRKELFTRIQNLATNFKLIIISLITALAVFTPQFIYWYKTTGHFIFYSYGVNDESFVFWKQPKIAQVLFGVQAGWLPYTPLMIFFFIGLFMTSANKKFHAPAIFIAFLLILYTCASWWKFNFACAFGYRSFVEYYTIFMIPVGYIFQQAFRKTLSWKAILIFPVLVLFCYLNIRMSRGYAGGWQYCDDAFSWNDYWRMISYIF